MAVVVAIVFVVASGNVCFRDGFELVTCSFFCRTYCSVCVCVCSGFFFSLAEIVDVDVDVLFFVNSADVVLVFRLHKILLWTRQLIWSAALTCFSCRAKAVDSALLKVWSNLLSITET